MKKIYGIIILCTLFAVCLCGCAKETAGKNTASANDSKIKIVTTIFPEYDWVMNILGDKKDDADVTLLLDKGVDLHSFQPSADDIMKISDCDMFIYVGGESDGWVHDALSQAVNKDMVAVNLLETLGDRVKEEETVEGMEHEHEDGDEHEDGEEHDHEDEEELDEHVWLSLDNAALVCDVITESVSKIDPANADVYSENLKAYKAELSKLDAEYENAVSSASKNTVLFADRFPFRYLTDDYGLEYFAAFSGCSAESEASFETVIFLAGKIDQLGLNTILTIENNDQKIAKTVRENTAAKDMEILTMNSMQSVTSTDIKNGTTYLEIMQDNLEVLTQALK